MLKILDFSDINACINICNKVYTYLHKYMYLYIYIYYIYIYNI